MTTAVAKNEDDGQRILRLIEDNVVPDKILENVLALRENMSPDRETFEEDTSAFTIPSVKIVYGTTQDAARPKEARIGEMFTTAGEYIGESMRFIVLFHTVTHTMWPEGKAASSTPDCRSPDGKVAINGAICADCPELPWRDGKRTRCGKSHEFLVADEDFSQIYRITFSKTNFKIGTRLRKLAKAAWGSVFEITTREETGQQGKYPVYEITMAKAKVGDSVAKDRGLDVDTTDEEEIEKVKKARADTFEIVKAFASDLKAFRKEQAEELRERAKRAQDIGASNTLSPEQAGAAAEGAIDAESEPADKPAKKKAKTEDPEVGFEGGM